MIATGTFARVDAVVDSRKGTLAHRDMAENTRFKRERRICWLLQLLITLAFGIRMDYILYVLDSSRIFSDLTLSIYHLYVAFVWNIFLSLSLSLSWYIVPFNLNHWKKRNIPRPLQNWDQSLLADWTFDHFFKSNMKLLRWQCFFWKRHQKKYGVPMNSPFHKTRRTAAGWTLASKASKVENHRDLCRNIWKKTSCWSGTAKNIHLVDLLHDNVKKYIHLTPCLPLVF